MEQTEYSTKLGHKIQTQGNHPKEGIHPSQHGQSFKSRLTGFVSTCLGFFFNNINGFANSGTEFVNNRHGLDNTTVFVNKRFGFPNDMDLLATQLDFLNKRLGIFRTFGVFSISMSYIFWTGQAKRKAQRH
jgi:hypothetical protein